MSAETSKLRLWRTGHKFSLDHVCSLIEKHGHKRPSEAKLSRIERDQDIPPDLLPALEAITGIPAKELHPELAKIFEGSAQ
jgi:hypothetical protein